MGRTKEESMTRVFKTLKQLNEEIRDAGIPDYAFVCAMQDKIIFDTGAEEWDIQTNQTAAEARAYLRSTADAVGRKF